MEPLGFRVRIDPLDEWTNPQSNGDDIVLGNVERNGALAAGGGAAPRDAALAAGYLVAWSCGLLGVLLLGAAVLGLVTRSERRLQWGLRTAAAGSAALALLGPGVPGGAAPQGASAVDVWFVVDTTSSAAARDYDGGKERLEGYRADTAAIAQELSGAKYALITFDSRGRLTMPLTDDATALASAMEILDTESTFRAKGSSITVARDALRETLERAEEKDPGRAHVVFYLGDGEQTSSEPGTPFDVADLVDGGAVLGYGTEEGGRMATTNADGSTGDDVTDASGNPGVSKIDEAKLEEIAEQLGVPYTHRAGGDIGPALEEADPGTTVDGAGTEIETYTSLVWVAAVIACALLPVDLFPLTREIGRLRRVES